jgi:hypothetical protein
MREDANLFGVQISLVIQIVFRFKINNVMVHIVIDALFLHVPFTGKNGVDGLQFSG